MVILENTMVMPWTPWSRRQCAMLIRGHAMVTTMSMPWSAMAIAKVLPLHMPWSTMVSHGRCHEHAIVMCAHTMVIRGHTMAVAVNCGEHTMAYRGCTMVMP